MLMLKGVVLTVNYPDDECEAAIPSDMSMEQLFGFLRRLADSEPDMTSFVLTASVAAKV